MPLENLLPISDAVIAHAQLFHSRCIGQNMRLHSAQEGVPSLEGARIAIIGVRENRGAVDLLVGTQDYSCI